MVSEGACSKYQNLSRLDCANPKSSSSFRSSAKVTVLLATMSRCSSLMRHVLVPESREPANRCLVQNMVGRNADRDGCRRPGPFRRLFLAEVLAHIQPVRSILLCIIEDEDQRL